MDDPYTTLKPGDRGSIDFFDDTGTAFVTWDNGSSLGLVYGVDHFKAITENPRYEDGAHFWRDTTARSGQDEALGICGRHLEAQLALKLSDPEKQFCRELFAAMYEAAAGLADPNKIVYPYTLEQANDRLEESHYNESYQLNADCARAIDAAINDSCYETNYYNLELASMVSIHTYGFERVNAVLAHALQRAQSDGRYSNANKTWALRQDFEYPGAAFGNAYLRAHPILIESLINYSRKFYADLGAERFALPGREESGMTVNGYELTRSIWFDDRRGFAIGHCPTAPDPYVCWWFTIKNENRVFYWGTYCGEKEAADNYRARIIAHMKDGGMKEIPSPLAAADKLIHSEGRPSTLAQIRAAKMTPKPPRAEKSPKQRKHKGDIER
jgi:hypothetical protein